MFSKFQVNQTQISSKEIAEVWFALMPGEDSRFKCACGAIIVQNRKSGYTNLVNHVKKSWR